MCGLFAILCYSWRAYAGLYFCTAESLLQAMNCLERIMSQVWGQSERTKKREIEALSLLTKDAQCKYLVLDPVVLPIGAKIASLYFGVR